MLKPRAFNQPTMPVQQAPMQDRGATADKAISTIQGRFGGQPQQQPMGQMQPRPMGPMPMNQMQPMGQMQPMNQMQPMGQMQPRPMGPMPMNQMQPRFGRGY